MTVIKVRLAVPDELVDLTSDTGLTERGYLQIADNLNIGQIVDVEPEIPVEAHN